MKDTAANIRRGREAMNKAITESTDVKRAMYRNDIGWVDFVWGAEGKADESGRTKGAMGISHIIEARQRKDGMSRDDVVKMLTQDIVEAIGEGSVSERYELKGHINLKIDHNGHRATLTKSKGSNAWMVTAFELYEDANSKDYGKPIPTGHQSYSARTDAGASYVAAGSDRAATATGLDEQGSNTALERAQPDGRNRADDTQAHSRRGRSLVADDKVNVPPELIEINTLHQTVEQAVGKNNMRHIDIVARETLTRLDNAQDLQGAQGWYNPKTGKVTLVADALTNVRTAQFVAWHELGHRKIDVDGWEKWQALFRTAYNGNPVIKQVADNIFNERKGAADGAALNKFLAVEEAVADLYAAHKTSDYAAFEQRNGVKVPQAMRNTLGGYFARMAEHLRTVLAKVMGVERKAISDAEIYGWLKKLDKAGDKVSDGLGGDAKFSRAGDLLSQAKQKVADLVRRVRADKGLREQVDLMPVSETAVVEAAEHGLDIVGYTHMLDSSAVNHVLNNHGNAKSEAARGQIGVKDSDFTAIINALENPDKVIYGSQNNAGREQIAYISRLDDGSLLVLQEQRVGKRKLALMSMRKYPATVDDSSVIRTLLPNARSDGGNKLSIVDKPKPRNTENDTKFSRSDNDHSSKSAQKSFEETAEANGGRRMYEQMKLTGDTELAYEQWVQVRTPEFKAWFGDWESSHDSASKIVNPKTGEPLVVYHGSMSRFNVFDTDLIYTTPDKDYTIVKNSDVKYGLFVNMRNPSKVDFKTIEYANNHPEKVSAIKKQGYDSMIFSAENDITALGGSANPFWDIPQFVSFEKSDVKSATGNSGAFDAKNDDIRFSRGKDLSPQEKRLFNEIGELEVGVKAYNKLAGLLKPAFAKIRMANTAPEQFTQMMRDYRAQLNVAGRTAKTVADAGVKMTEAERKLLSDVLEQELAAGVEVSPELQELAAAMREILTQQSDDLVALDMLSEASRERFKDTYLPRLYAKHMTGDTALDALNKELGKAMRGALGNAVKGQHLKGRGLFKEVKRGEQTAYEADGWEMRHDYGNKGKKAGQVVMWRDYTREERASMGEERDAMMRFTSGYIKTQSDIAKGMLFKRIAEDGEMTSDTAVDGWTHVPDTEIAGTGGVKRYGALAGKWVHPEVAYHLQQQFYIDNAVQKVWRAILGWWKLGKTVYNAVAHVNNFISNIAMTYIAGGRLRDLPAMALEMKRKGALYNEALEHGLIGDAVDVAGLQEMFVGLNNVRDDKLLDGLIMRTLKRADKLALNLPSKAAKAAQKAYRVEDEVFKLVLYKRGKEAGLSPQEAADYALTFMFDYSEVPQGVKWLRDTGVLPFVSYTYKAMPAMARLALTRPHRALMVTGFLYGVNALSYALLGGAADEDEEREYMPDYQKGYTAFGTPKLIRLPWNDSKGKPIFIDVYRWLPLGDFADTQNQMGGLPLPQWATPNGPVISHAFALIGNKDTFTGRDIVKPYQSGGEKAATYGKWLAAQWLPASVGVPFSYHTNNVLEGAKSQFEGTKMADALEWMGYTGTTYRGEDKQLYRSLPGAFGVKLRGEKPADMKAAKQRQIGYEVREVKADMSRIRRDNTLTDAAKQARLEKRREALERLYEKRPD